MSKLITGWRTYPRPDGKVAVSEVSMRVSSIPSWVGAVGFFGFATITSACLLGVVVLTWVSLVPLLHRPTPVVILAVILGGVFTLVAPFVLWEQIWRHAGSKSGPSTPLDGVVVCSTTKTLLCSPNDVLPDGSLVKDHMPTTKWRTVRESETRVSASKASSDVCA